MKFLVALALTLSFVVTAYPAKYKGKSIDGKKYAATVSHSDGLFGSADVRFEGLVVHVYFETWTHTLYLTKETIDDPKKILARDSVHGWIIELRDKLD